MTTWIEVTKTEHQHGGVGWEFGTRLWSPSTDRAGRDAYSVMRLPQVGDQVIHFLKDNWPEGRGFRITGRSRVADSYSEVVIPPPQPGSWDNRESYYKIPVTNYQAFPQTIAVEDFIEMFYDEIDAELRQRNQYYPFVPYRNRSEIRLGQGVYLARCTDTLYKLISTALEPVMINEVMVQGLGNSHHEYYEGQRKRRETTFFARNPDLVAEAKRVRGTACECCGFDFAVFYGDLGAGYIECHHLNPLSERPQEAWDSKVTTNTDDVRLLCANCHRVVHRKKPALTMAELEFTMRRMDRYQYFTLVNRDHDGEAEP